MMSLKVEAVRVSSLAVLLWSLACRGFNWPQDLNPNGAGQSSPIFSVTGTNPADGAGVVANNTQIVVNFSETVNTGLLSYNMSNGPCSSNNIQVSADDFASCIALGTPVWGGSQTTLSVTPTAVLANGATYKIRVLPTLAAASGRILSLAFTTPSGFTTAPPLSED